MSDHGDKTCPLCAEDMDLTDQQLKPCKCGYEICVWCWHQIMDMAEKENTEGRCPACRTSYNKEQIIGMAANCKRLMMESNTEKRYKTQKSKLKMPADARKDLSRVRVVQRNLVYIMGLPSRLADESVLERKEYFGKYGKILKLSISRPTATTQQAFSNCFCVYITYAREEDAVRCIQSVHNYTLEGKSLRASFGTTKYCHSWLRNMTCSNPDCLYLHDIGCQEDSFTKDEILSAYSSRVPQVALNNLQRRAGNVLPTPDDIGTNGTAPSKTCSRMPLNNTTNHVKAADVSSGRSIVLPTTASWGSRVPNKCPPPTATPCLKNLVKQKPDFFNSSTPFHSSVSDVNCISAWDDHVSVLSKAHDNGAVDGGSRTSEPLNHVSSMHDHPVVSDDSSETSVVAKSTVMISAWDDDTTTKAPKRGNITHLDSPSNPQELLKVNFTRDEMTSGLCKSMEIVFDEACNYGWDDDVDATSNQITDPSFYHMDGKTASFEALRCCSDRDSQTSLSEDTTVGDTSYTSGISCSSQLSDTLTGDKDGLVAHEIASLDSVNVESLKCNDSLSKRVDCDDAISNNIAPNEDAKSLYLGISAVNFDSQPVVDHHIKDKYQSVSSNNCSNLSDGSSSITLCPNYPNRESERQSSVPSSHASVSTDSQSFLIDLLPGWASDRQSEVPLAMENDDNYSLANDDQRGKLSNVSIRTTFSPCCLNPPKISCFPTSNTCIEDACDLQYPTVSDSLAMDAVMDEGSSTLRDHGAVPPVVTKQDQHEDYALQTEVFETPDMRRTENKPSYLVKSDDLATIKTENIDAGEESIISNMLSLDFDPWDDSFPSTNNFAKLLSKMDKKVDSSALSSSWKLQSNNQSRFSFARQENLANASTNYSLAASHVEKPSCSIQESFKDGYHNNILLDTIGGPNVVLNNVSRFSSNNSVGTLRSNMPAPPGLSSPNRAPPPGFSYQERSEQAYRSTVSENLFHSSPHPNHLELHSVRNAGDVEFIDPAILAVGKGILPLEVNNSVLGLNSVIPSQFSTTEGNRIQSLMQHSIAAHQDRRFSDNNIPNGLSTMHDAYISSRFPVQINNTNYSPFTHQQLRTSNILNNKWSDWPNVLNDSGMGVMTEIANNERFGHDNLRLSSSNYLYTRPYGM